MLSSLPTTTTTTTNNMNSLPTLLAEQACNSYQWNIYLINLIRFVFCSIELSFRFIIFSYFSNILCLEIVMMTCSSTSRLPRMPRMFYVTGRVGRSQNLDHSDIYICMFYAQQVNLTHKMMLLRNLMMLIMTLPMLF